MPLVFRVPIIVNLETAIFADAANKIEMIAALAHCLLLQFLRGSQGRAGRYFRLLGTFWLLAHCALRSIAAKVRTLWSVPSYTTYVSAFHAAVHVNLS